MRWVLVVALYLVVVGYVAYAIYGCGEVTPVEQMHKQITKEQIERRQGD